MLTAGLFIIFSIGFVVLRKQTPVSVGPANTAVATKTTVNRGLPTRLKIPKLNVDAAVTYMGLDKVGNMDTPTSTTDVGWYKYGPLPGNTGSAVISGHINGPKGEPAVFSQLAKLEAGDQFNVTDSTGQSTAFVVREKRTYGQDEQPPEVFTSSSGAQLNLITCAGEWDKAQRQFLERLVIFADAVV